MNHSQGKSLVSVERRARKAGTDDLVGAVQAVSRRLVAVTAAALGAMEDEIGMSVTLPEYRALVLLSEHGELAPFELAEQLGVTRPAVTRIIRRLSHRRLIKRRRHNDDRRQARLQLSRRGRSIVDAVTQERARRLRPALRGLSGAERSTLLDVLWRIHRSLESGARAPAP